MQTKTIDVYEAQTDLPGLVALVAAGNEIVLTVGDAPVARLVPAVNMPRQRVAGLHPGAMRAGDDFDEPLPDQFWLGAT